MTSKKLTVVVGALTLLLLVAGVSFADYDKAKVVAVMRANVAAMPKLNAAAGTPNYMEAAAQLLTLSYGMFSIKDYTPLKGEKTGWDATFAAFLKATWRGLAACADENQANLKAAIAEIQKTMQSGHGSFK